MTGTVGNSHASLPRRLRDRVGLGALASAVTSSSPAENLPNVTPTGPYRFFRAQCGHVWL
ncbi:hypothetical protein ABZ892_09075 [Streptomyces sp. NPDC046924]|uniref:hypothetical protein n=1 Tax=Streptomyces sp. NPDC046924 TaxID=3155136 RepID=UPI0033E155BC